MGQDNKTPLTLHQQHPTQYQLITLPRCLAASPHWGNLLGPRVGVEKGSTTRQNITNIFFYSRVPPLSNLATSELNMASIVSLKLAKLSARHNYISPQPIA